MSPEMMLVKALSTKEPEIEKVAEAENTEAMEKLSWADEFGRELAREHMEKIAINPMGSATKAFTGAAKAGLGKVMHGATTAGLGTRMGVGAAGGAALGGAAGFMKNPGVDPATGKQRSRIGGALAGAAGGAALGAGAGAAAKSGAMALGSSNTRVGRIAGQSLKAEAGATGNLAARQAATQMQLGRGQRMAAAKTAVKPAAAPAAVPAGNPQTQPRLGKTLDQIRSGR